MVRRIGWTLWSVVLIVVLVGLSYYVYGISTGQFDVGHQGKSASGSAQADASDPDDVKVPEGADTSVGALLGMPRSEPADFAVGKSLVFRTESGNAVCAFSDEKGALGTDLILPFKGEDGSGAAAPSVQCGLVRAVVLHPEDQKTCKAGYRSGDTLAVWPGGRGAGACVEDGQPLRFDAEVEDNPNPDQRMKLKQLEYGKRIQRNGWACGDDGETLTCAELATGRGFQVETDTYRLLDAVK
ncbi:hypothetical protein QP139_00820 [Winkia sp. UMB10116]|uniref:hypothetical protein n=1 Tax=Winkia sp. UMB10116 TaxID=3046355 RepID=UPI002556078A|nr:hypothetical protein [Winkia sp. UMB10116]MDK6240039.1 hypothetical protein [Winkia sp. UMB10116]